MPRMTKQHVHRIRVPNPFMEGRTCAYVLRTDPVTLIDTGIATDRAWEVLVEGLREHDLAPADVRRIILTHKHIDHIGSAWKLQRDQGAEIFIHETETAAITDVDPTGQRYAGMARGRLDEWGVPEEARPETLTISGPQWNIESAEATPLVDGQLLPTAVGDIAVIHTPGHTLGSICLKYNDILFAGDHVLPDISPNVGGGDLRNRGLLPLYLDSLAKIRDVCRDEQLLVMPGHGDPMESVTERCDDLIRHHEARLDQIITILAGEPGLSVYEVACRLFGKMDSFHVILGGAEAHAHLERLVEQSRAVEELGKFSVC